jgi:hypothetical protein
MKKILCFALTFIIAGSALAISVHGPDKNAYVQKTFVLQDDSISVASATTNPVSGGNLKLFDMPEGFLLIHGVVVDILPTSTNVTAAGDTLTWGLGTTANATGNGAIGAGETNLAYIVQTSTYTSGVIRAQGQILNAGDIRLDGSATAPDIYLNVYTTNALSATGASSLTVLGEVTVTYSVLGDD